MKRQKLELSLTQFWSEEFRNELAASVRRPIRQPADTSTAHRPIASAAKLLEFLAA